MPQARNQLRHRQSFPICHPSTKPCRDRFQLACHQIKVVVYRRHWAQAAPRNFAGGGGGGN